ncbi:MAG: DUF5106 domain-containing protein [Muribaculaceae bacterium]|nr:DUF5106 domain-containing protein [Muribaculaceae bacterium]
MKRLFFIAITAIAILCAGPAKADTKTYFPYPMVPDSISTLQGKADFYITHFWDLCDLKKGFSSRAKMAGALHDYFDLMPHASARTAHRSVALLLKELDKQPSDQLFFAQKAEEFIHSDTSRMYSDELFLPFARAVVNNRRISSKDKQHFIHQANVLTASQTGARVPDIQYTDRNGNKSVYTPDSTQVTLIFFNNPDTEGGNLAKLRLDADAKATSFINSGVMKVVAISSTEPDDNWNEYAKSLPESWTVGAAPGIDDIFDIRYTPSFYIIDQNGNILLKNVNIDSIISIISNL